MSEETSPTSPVQESSSAEVAEKPLAASESTVDPTPPAVTSESPETTSPPAPEESTEPDAIQPYVDKVKENIQLALEDPNIGKFLRAHIKTFREEWDGWSDNAKYTYTHMMTAQLLQRQAAATQIAIGNQFKLPSPSAQTQLMESIKRALTKPPKGRPALSVPVKLRPTSSQK